MASEYGERARKLSAFSRQNSWNPSSRVSSRSRPSDVEEGGARQAHRGFDHHRQRPGNDLAVDRIRHRQIAVLPAQEAQVDCVFEIVRRHVGTEKAAFEDRLDHPAQAGLAQSFGERVEVGIPAQHQAFLGLLDRGRSDLFRSVGHFDLDQLPRQRVDQPGLTLGQLEDARQRFGLEDLTGRSLVLPAKRGHFFGGEITQGERLDLDVER